jgi:hypothetical protein
VSTASLLRRHWLWLVPGLLVAITLAALSMRGSNEFASASTQVLVDWAGAPYLIDVKQPLDPLAERAGVFARLAPGPVMVDRIAAKAGVDPAQITASGPYKPGAEVTEREPSAERRAVQLAAERDRYRLRFDAEREQGIPIVSIISQAPTVDGANRLADSSAAALIDYVGQLQRENEVPPLQRVELRRLGTASGAVVNPGTDVEVAGLRFIGTLLAWILLLVAVLRFGSGLRLPGERRAADSSVPELLPDLHADARAPELYR